MHDEQWAPAEMLPLGAPNLKLFHLLRPKFCVAFDRIALANGQVLQGRR